MDNEMITSEQLKSLLKEKGSVCISIILPTHRISTDRRVDKMKMISAMNTAKQLLQYKYPIAEIKNLLNSIDEIYQKIAFTHNTEGIGLFISSKVQLIVQFPFPVEEKVMVGESFEVRDLIYKENSSIPYLVIVLSKNTVRLYNGVLDKLTEVIDDNFPKTYEEEYEYNPPSRGTPFAGVSTVRNFEKEKSSMKEIRFEQFFLKADKQLQKYTKVEMPILLMGVEKDMAWFEKISKHTKKIKDKINGNYDYLNEKQLIDIVWPTMYKYIQNQKKLVIKELEEKIGKHLVISGVAPIWKATKEGNSLKLLVEKDFRKSGFITDEGYLFHERPTEKAYEIVTDAVDDIMEMVIAKGGEVVLTENHLLNDYQKIVLITRY